MRRLALLAVFLLAACTGSGKVARPAASGPLNDADVTFAQRILAQDDQTTEIVELVSGHTARPELHRLAKDVTIARGVELTRLQDWLQRWGKPVQPEEGDPEAQPPGLLTDEQLNQLDALSGSKFDLAFVDALMAMDQSAVQLAGAQLAHGSLAEVRQLAEQLQADRRAQVDQLTRWKQAWS